MLSRRTLLRNMAAAGSLGLLPRRLQAAPADPAGRKFLFVFAWGGWDPTWVFAPMFDSPFVDMDARSEPYTVGGLTVVDGPDRPSVRTFFDRYAAQSCILNAFEVRSVTHERCRRLLMTGNSISSADDWPSILAGSAVGYTLPHLVVSGPAYTSQYTTSVMRLGETGQFATLLDGTALLSSEQRAMPLVGDTQAAVDNFLAQRIADFEARAGIGRAQRFAADLSSSSAQTELVRHLGNVDLSVQLNGITPVSELVKPALACFEAGYSRCAIVAHEGQYNITWDSHSNIADQARHYESLFGDLLQIMNELETRRSPSGRLLSEEVVVVLCSEMGRGPRTNATGGKDHWTFTSAMFVGPGVQGGQVLGAYDENLLGMPVDLDSGLPSETGTLLAAENFGATVLALADLEADAEPVRGLLA